MLTPTIILISIALYFLTLILISYIAGRKAGKEGYFLGNKNSPWIVVALGMLSDSLSGVTYISVPGDVGANGLTYFQVVLGFFAGYFVIAFVLLPLYYRQNLTSIYTYLENRIGNYSQKTGATYFIISRLAGAAGRLYLSIAVLQLFVFDALGIPFGLSAAITIALILFYTYKGGIQSLVWTDVFQSFLLIFSLVISIWYMTDNLNWNWITAIKETMNGPHSKIFEWGGLSKGNFWKQFIGGAFISICMTGLDQNMMQKNLSCRSLKDAQKNMVVFSFIMLAVTSIFIWMGSLLYAYVDTMNIAMPDRPDYLFPTIALNHLGMAAALSFIVGLAASTFSSSDSVLTTLTTSFYIDIWNGEKKILSKKEQTNARHLIHICFGILLLLLVYLFKQFNNDSIIYVVLKVASYTYGPLLGLFAFGILTKRKTDDKLVPFISIAAPALCWVLDKNSKELFGGYQFSYELLALNGALVFMFLWILSKKQTAIRKS